MLFLLVSGLISHAQDKGAKIEFKAYTIDYGTINKGADGIRTFEFTNTGDEPLIVSNVKSSCGCTIPKNQKNRFYLVKMVKLKLNMILTE